MTEIRPIIAADVDSFVAAYESVSAEGIWIGGELPLSEGKLASLRRSAVDQPDDQLSLVAVDDGTVVGWGVVHLAPYGRAEIGMALVDGYRGQGLGRRLLDGVIDWARSRGAHKIDLEVWPHNAAAIALYERAGFVREGYRRRHWRRESGALWDSVEMSLLLDTDAPGSPHLDEATP